MSFICEIFPVEVIRLLLGLEELGVRVSVGDGQLVIEPATLLTPGDRALVSQHLEPLVLAAAFATDLGVRQAVADYLERPQCLPDAQLCRCGAATDTVRCWRCEIAGEIATALEKQSVAESAAA